MQATIKSTGIALDHPAVAVLQTIPDPPQALYAAGAIPMGTRVAIVGSRRATAYGRQVTASLATRVARAGGVVVSGLAFGIDVTALQAALNAGGKCIVVLPGGISDEMITPRTNYRIAQGVLRQGGLLSEQPPDQSAHKGLFLARNRLISGLAAAVVVVEAELPSGSLTTAQHAIEQGRDVWAVPGPVTSAVSRGANHLLSEGAHVLYGSEAFCASLGLTQSCLSQDDNPILALLSDQPQSAELLQPRSGLSAAEFASQLTKLELAGLIRKQGAAYMRS